MKKLAGTVLAAGVACATLFTTALPAEAAGTQSYTNRQTGRVLTNINVDNVVTANPSTALKKWTPVTVGSYKQIRFDGGSRCLDSNFNKQVYTNTCDPNNIYMQWTIVKNGSFILFKNRATDLCLDSNENGTVYTNPCNLGNFYLNWY